MASEEELLARIAELESLASGFVSVGRAELVALIYLVLTDRCKALRLSQEGERRAVAEVLADALRHSAA